MSQHTYIIKFDANSHAEASQYANELRHFLLETSPDLTVQRRRSDPLTQDMGSTLVLILGTPAFVAMVEALGNWLQMRSKASLTIENGHTKIRLENVTSKTALVTLEQWFAQQESMSGENKQDHKQ